MKEIFDVLTISVGSVFCISVYSMRILKIREPGVPARISIIAILVFLISLGIKIGNDFSEEQLWIKIGLSVLFNAFWSVIWILYFKLSKRVKAYYGANAVQKFV